MTDPHHLLALCATMECEVSAPCTPRQPRRVEPKPKPTLSLGWLRALFACTAKALALFHFRLS